jgi:hypothetical protein
MAWARAKAAHVLRSGAGTRPPGQRGDAVQDPEPDVGCEPIHEEQHCVSTRETHR